MFLSLSVRAVLPIPGAYPEKSPLLPRAAKGDEDKTDARLDQLRSKVERLLGVTTMTVEEEEDSGAEEARSEGITVPIGRFVVYKVALQKVQKKKLQKSPLPFLFLLLLLLHLLLLLLLPSPLHRRRR